MLAVVAVDLMGEAKDLVVLVEEDKVLAVLELLILEEVVELLEMVLVDLVDLVSLLFAIK
jgi:hypothetical protein